MFLRLFCIGAVLLALNSALLAGDDSEINVSSLKKLVKVVDTAHVSSAVDDVTVEVSWKTVGIKRKSTDTINFTVRTLHHLNVVSNTRSHICPNNFQNALI